MVYIPELDRQGFADRQSKQQRRNRPAVQFTRRDDVRDLMKSPAGKNYGNMLDLQSQAIRQGGFDKDDPKIAELKKARRQYNRKDKYNIANQMGYSPQDANEIYRQNSGVLREHAHPTYKKMYPMGDALHNVGGGLTGMLLNQSFGKSQKAGKKFFDDLRKMGGDILGAVGIGGAVPREEATEEVLTNYADNTFGEVADESVEEVYEGPWPHEGMPYLSDEAAAIQKEFNTNPYFQNLLDPNVVLPFEKDRRGHPHRETYTPDAGPRLGKASPHDPTEGIRVEEWLTDPDVPMPEELVEGEYLPGQFYDELIEEEIPAPIPFDDSGRESGIRGLAQHLKPNKYEEEFRDYIESGGDFMPYHQFERMYEEIYQGKPHALHSSYR